MFGGSVGEILTSGSDADTEITERLLFVGDLNADEHTQCGKPGSSTRQVVVNGFLIHSG